MIEIKEVPIGDLNPAEYNPRIWREDDVKHLTESIQRFGMVDPIIVNGAPERKNVVIGGHFRLHVAKGLGYKTVPVVYVDVPDINKEQELNIRLNKNTGQWDLSMLANIHEDILKHSGFSNGELDRLFTEIDIPKDEQEPQPKMVTCPNCRNTFDAKEVKL